MSSALNVPLAKLVLWIRVYYKIAYKYSENTTLVRKVQKMAKPVQFDVKRPRNDPQAQQKQLYNTIAIVTGKKQLQRSSSLMIKYGIICLEGHMLQGNKVTTVHNPRLQSSWNPYVSYNVIQ